MTALGEFLLARITEDEVEAMSGRSCGEAHPGMDIYHPDGHPDPRAIAECKAKRAIVELFPSGPDGDGWDDAGWQVLHALAAVYADHEDYPGVVPSPACKGSGGGGYIMGCEFCDSIHTPHPDSKFLTPPEPPPAAHRIEISGLWRNTGDAGVWISCDNCPDGDSEGYSILYRGDGPLTPAAIQWMATEHLND